MSNQTKALSRYLGLFSIFFVIGITYSNCADVTFESKYSRSQGSSELVCCGRGDVLIFGARALPFLDGATHTPACAQPHEFPIVTHWDESIGNFSLGASGAPRFGRTRI